MFCHYCEEGAWDAIGCIRVEGRDPSEGWRLVAVCAKHAELAGRRAHTLRSLSEIAAGCHGPWVTNESGGRHPTSGADHGPASAVSPTTPGREKVVPRVRARA